MRDAIDHLTDFHAAVRAGQPFPLSALAMAMSADGASRLTATATATASATATGAAAAAAAASAAAALSARRVEASRAASLRGKRVMIGGLDSRPELNGRCGTAGAFDEAKGRLAVTFDEGGDGLLLKLTNLVSVGDE
eukprot:3875955-Pleurochrysis_carterae.AAC.1